MYEIDTDMSNTPRSLSAFLDNAERHGQLNVRTHEMAEALAPTSPSAVYQALHRQQRRGRLLRLSRGSGHWVIVPLQYASSGAPPIESWLDTYLRKTLALPYYVGLLSAAEAYGASPYAVMVTQIAVPKPRRALMVGRHKLVFYTRSHVDNIPTQWHESRYGRYRISSPEMTALELVKRSNLVGGMSRVNEIVASLFKPCSSAGMLEALTATHEIPAAQRLGTLLKMNNHPELADTIKRWLSDKSTRTISLDSSGEVHPNDTVDDDFHVIITRDVANANS